MTKRLDLRMYNDNVYYPSYHNIESINIESINIMQNIKSIVDERNKKYKIIYSDNNLSNFEDYLTKIKKGNIYVYIELWCQYKIFSNDEYFVHFEILNDANDNKKIIGYIKN